MPRARGAAGAALLLLLARLSSADEGGAHNAHELIVPRAISPRAPRALQVGASVSFNATTIDHRGAVLVVATTDPAQASALTQAWVGLYSPPDANVSTTTPVRFQMLVADARWNASGVARFAFSLGNLHAGGYRARLIVGGLAAPGATTGAPTGQATTTGGGAKPWTSLTGVAAPAYAFAGALLAESPADVVFAAPAAATHVRVTPAASADRYTVIWNAAPAATGGFVRWALTAAAAAAGAGARAAAAATRVTPSDVCVGGPAATTGFRSMGTQWVAELALGAAAGRTVWYVVGDDAGASPPRALAVPPARGAPGAVSLMLLADQGVGYADDSFSGRNYNDGRAALAVARRAAAHAAGAVGALPAVAAVVVGGDMSYADGYLAQWEDWLDMMEPAAARVPLLIGAGNHESVRFRRGRGGAGARARALVRALAYRPTPLRTGWAAAASARLTARRPRPTSGRRPPSPPTPSRAAASAGSPSSSCPRAARGRRRPGTLFRRASSPSSSSRPSTT